jgi:hypothetical protein
VLERGDKREEERNKGVVEKRRKIKKHRRG